jgi:hypothetical protein
MEIQVEVDVYCEGRTEHVTIILDQSDIASLAEIRASEQYHCLSAAAKRIEVKPYAINL